MGGCTTTPYHPHSLPFPATNALPFHSINPPLGLLDLSLPLLSHLSSLSNPSSTPTSASPDLTLPSPGFSDFLLSSHLHIPRLRLVNGSPSLKLSLLFAHVPEVEDGCSLTWFLPSSSDSIGGRKSSEIVELICNEMGLRRTVLKGSKSARVEYSLADFDRKTLGGRVVPQEPLNL